MRPFFQNAGRKESRQRFISEKNQGKVWRFGNLPVLRREKRKSDFGIGKSESYPWRAGEKKSSPQFGSFQIFCGVGNERKMKKFPKISAYSGLCGVVRNREKFLQINVHFALFSFVGIREGIIAAALAKSPPAALKVLRGNFRKTQQTRRRMTDSERTARKPPLSKSKILPQYQISLTAHFVLWESCWGCHPKPAFCGLRRLKKSRKNFFGFFSKTLPLLPLFFSH